MTSSLKKLAVVAALSFVAAGTAQAQEVLVTADITSPTTWTANNFYNLQGQIYVRPGATLTIEAGVVVASDSGGGLAVAKGGQIFINGTAKDPVIMTSKLDVATWDVDGSHPTGADPETGSWRAVANEWANLTIMGAGYISEDKPPAGRNNVPTCNANNVAEMEGLIADPQNPNDHLYGGGDDDDDSGSISYLSIRYGGLVQFVNRELNGLSLGALGRGTDIDHVEIMNNIDDGIEIWGGTVNLKYFSIWNVGDDSLDIDQGWRGKGQFGLIVQGYSVDDSQGSGVGDNCIEHDGAENSDWEPVTTGVLYNMTVIGQPDIDTGDGATTWRDGCRMQHRNSIFMDIGEQVVRFDNDDGDCGRGYGFSNTLSWTDVWDTDWDWHVSNSTCPNPSTVYQSQVDGKLAEIKDSVFFHNNHPNAYREAENIGGGGLNIFTAAGYDNVKEPFDSPIKGIAREAAFVLPNSGFIMERVTGLDPRPAADALTSVGSAPNDGFFTPAKFRGAFNPGDPTWLHDWSAADRFGMLAEKPLCYDMKVGNRVVGEACFLRGARRATIVLNDDPAVPAQFQCQVICDDERINVITANPLVFEFRCAGFPKFTVSQNGPVLDWVSGSNSGTFVRK